MQHIFQMNLSYLTRMSSRKLLYSFLNNSYARMNINNRPYHLFTVTMFGNKLNFNILPQVQFAIFHTEVYDVQIPSTELETLKMHVEMLRSSGEEVPDELTDEQWKALYLEPTKSKQAKYLRYLHKKKFMKESTLRKRELNKELYKKMFAEKLKIIEEEKHISYGLWHNSMFMKTRRSTIVDFYNLNVMNALRLGNQPLVIDCGFQEQMVSRELTSCAEQIILCINHNRLNQTPFNIKLVNLNSHSNLGKKLKKYMPNIFSSMSPVTATDENYLDMYPKDNMVYLSPNARETMTVFDPNAVYVIGGIVDLGIMKPLTYAKAKKENIKAQRFPIDRYLKFKKSKSLGIHVAVGILLDMQSKDDWKTAFYRIPRRYIDDGTEDLDKFGKQWSVRAVTSTFKITDEFPIEHKETGELIEDKEGVIDGKIERVEESKNSKERLFDLQVDDKTKIEVEKFSPIQHQHNHFLQQQQGQIHHQLDEAEHEQQCKNNQQQQRETLSFRSAQPFRVKNVEEKLIWKYSSFNRDNSHKIKYNHHDRNWDSKQSFLNRKQSNKRQARHTYYDKWR